MNNRRSIHIFLQSFLLFLFISMGVNAQGIDETRGNKLQTEAQAFVSRLNEPYNAGNYCRKVFDDFSSMNVKGVGDLDIEAIGEIRILKLIGDKEFNQFLSKERTFDHLEALQVINASIKKDQFERLIADLSDKLHFKKLILFNCAISAVPPSIQTLERLETLDLSLNRIARLPNEVLELSQLKYLRLYNNRPLKSLPSELGKLSNLELLDFAGTSIAMLPKSIGDCTKLVHLTGNACNLKAIPKELGDCKSLKLINLGSNQIAALPVELSQLVELEILSLGNNLIKEVPAEYDQLTKLITFALDHNQLTVFPIQALSYQNLLNLWVHKNQIKNIPLEIANLKRLIAFLVDKNEFTAPQLEEIKKLNPRLRVITRY